MDEDERPKYPNKVLRTKVIKNPFDDLKPRNLIEMIKDEDTDKKPKSKMKATKDYKLLRDVTFSQPSCVPLSFIQS